MCLCVCVCVCLCVCVFYNRCIGHTLAKIKNVKNTFIDFLHLSSNDVIAKIILRDLDLLFEGQRFEFRPSQSGEQPFRCNMYE